MKTFFNISSLFFLFVFVTSCTQESMMNEDSLPNANICTNVIYSFVDDSVYANVNNQISTFHKSSTRNDDFSITEDDAQEILEPLVEDGELIVNQLLDLQEDLILTEEEIQQIENMTDAELAELAYIVHTSAICSVTDDVEQLQDGLETRYTWDEFSDCVMEATGLNDISNIINLLQDGGSVGAIVSGTRALLTASDIKALSIALAKRYAGWIGVFYTVYQLGVCLEGKVKSRNGDCQISVPINN